MKIKRYGVYKTVGTCVKLVKIYDTEGEAITNISKKWRDKRFIKKIMMEGKINDTEFERRFEIADVFEHAGITFRQLTQIWEAMYYGDEERLNTELAMYMPALEKLELNTASDISSVMKWINEF